MSELPKGWTLTELTNVCDVSTGKVDANHATVDGEYTFFTCAFEPFKSPTFSFEGELITLPGNGANVGHVNYYKGKIEAYQRTYVLHDIKVSSKYLYWQLKSKWKATNLDKQFGSATNYLKIGNFKSYSLPIAPLKEQIRIANKLDSILAKVDTAQARLDKIPNILKRFRQSVLAAATSGELTKEWREKHEYGYKRENIEGKFELDREIVKESTLPKHWQWVPLGNFAKCARGKFSIRPRNDPSCFDGVYPFIQIGDLPREGGGIISHKQTLNDKGYSVSREFEIGTVVIAIVGATIANTGLVTYPVCFPDSLVGINSPSNIENQYIDYHLRSIKEDIRQASYAGGGQPNIKLTIINPLPLPLPPYEEAIEIVRRVESLFTMADTVEKQYKSTKARTNRLTQSILAKAFRGELVPQYQNDESAELLLEKIKLAQKLTPKVNVRKKSTPIETSVSTTLSIENVKIWIDKSERSTFTSEEMIKSFNASYEEIKQVLFSLLNEKKPVVEQIFDPKIEDFVFKRVIK
ncbi:MAG: restriction endonuclease subunit S [Cocleimonas sp.]